MTTLVAAVLGLSLLGACAFGLWHVVVGGLIAGNDAALRFGLALSVATSLPLAGLLILARRLRR